MQGSCDQSVKPLRRTAKVLKWMQRDAADDHECKSCQVELDDRPLAMRLNRRNGAAVNDGLLASPRYGLASSAGQLLPVGRRVRLAPSCS